MRLDDIIQLRRDLHANPERGYEETRTSGIISRFLEDCGIEVHTNIARTGVVGLLRKGHSSRMIGLRADIDALPMSDSGTQPWKSQNPGIAHACGHDGHTAILLGAARELANNVQFDGTVCFIFQPAEEGLAGAKKMIDEGLFDRFPCDAIYALHNWPESEVGILETRSGPIMAAGDVFDIILHGGGGHAAQPHLTHDTLLAASELVLILNTITSRSLHPCEGAVITITQIAGGTSHNMIPATVKITGTARMFSPVAQDIIEKRINEVSSSIANAHGVSAEVNYVRYYPATINHKRESEVALSAAMRAGLTTREAVYPALTSEDFAFMLEKRPGTYAWLGSAPSHPLHHSAFDFNDDAIPGGVDWFVNLVLEELGQK